MTQSDIPPNAAPAPTVPYADSSTAPYPAPYGGPEPDQNAKTMGMLCHLLAFSGFVIPLGSVLGPLIMWLIKKSEHPFIDDQGKEAVNFGITVTIAMVISVILCFVLIGFLLLPIIGIGWIILVIIATTKANSGIAYRYPMTIRFVR